MRLVLSVLIALLATYDVVAQFSQSASPDIQREIGRVVRQRFDAYGRADPVAWGRFVADDFLGPASKAELQREIATRPSSVKIWYGEIADLRVRVHGRTAVVRYRVTEYVELGGRKIEHRQWRTETYLLRSGAWKLIAGIDSPIPSDPVVATIDPNLYDAYVGQYEYAPGAVDTITREGDRLMAQPTGQAKEELFPENETTFFGKGQDWRLIFVKDERGSVTHVLFRQLGQDLVGKKIK